MLAALRRRFTPKTNPPPARRLPSAPGTPANADTELSATSAKFPARAYDFDGTTYPAPRGRKIADLYRSVPPLRRVIDDIATEFASMPLLVQNKAGKELPEKHPICLLLAQLRPGRSTEQVLADLMRDFLLYDCCFAEATLLGKGRGAAQPSPMASAARPIDDIWRICPKDLQIKSSTSTALPQYITGVGDLKAEWPIANDGKCDVFYLLGYHPSHSKDEWIAAQGETVLTAAQAFAEMSAYQLTQALNGYTPQGYFETKDDRSLTPEQRKDLDGSITRLFRRNRADQTPPVLDGMTYKGAAQSNREAEFNVSLNQQARIICYAYGYPPARLGLPETTSYRNLAESRQAFILNCVLPRADIFWARFTQWSRQHFADAGNDFSISVNINEIPAMAERRAALMTQLNGVDFLSVNEKRQTVGLPPLPDDAADAILVGAGKQPLADAAASLDDSEDDAADPAADEPPAEDDEDADTPPDGK